MESTAFISFSYESFTVKSSSGHTTASIGSISDYGLMRCTFANILVIKTQGSQILHSYTKFQRKSTSKTYKDNGRLTALCLKPFKKSLVLFLIRPSLPLEWSLPLILFAVCPSLHFMLENLRCTWYFVISW